MHDHGILNVPLSKRGAINAQLGRYYADLARHAAEAQKAATANHKKMKADALQSIQALTDARAAELMAKFNLTRIQLNKKLHQIARHTPAMILKGI